MLRVLDVRLGLVPVVLLAEVSELPLRGLRCLTPYRAGAADRSLCCPEEATICPETPPCKGDFWAVLGL